MIVFIKTGESLQYSLYNDRETEEGAKEDTEEIEISFPSGFYDEDIQLTVLLPKEGIIFYTKDGSAPASEEGGSTCIYKEPIRLAAGAEESVQVYRFKAVFEDGTESDIVTNTYFMGKDIQSRYDTMVISLAAEYDDLFGEEKGIFVEGKLRADWLLEHPDEEIPYDAPANYNVHGRESERKVHIEVFEQDGKRVISQNGGIRISGNFSRQSPQKSFKLFARKEYDEQNRFCFPIFEDMRSFGDGVIFNKYKTLKISNTGNDRSEGFIRDELGLTLAKQAGFQDIQEVRSVCVYINGIYEGLYWLHSAYDEEYFEEKYGDYEGQMVVIGSSETHMMQEGGDEAEDRCAAEYNALYEKYSTSDLMDDTIYEELKGCIDVENYLQYYGLEIYMANRDWPYNNIQSYRYVAAEEEEYVEDSVFDGRFRYLLYDLDTSMGLGYIREGLNLNQSFETFRILKEQGMAPLFTALLQREDCRNYFISYICELINGAYSTENVVSVLADMHHTRENEMLRYIEESINNPDLPEIGDIYLEMQMDCIRAWAETAPESMLEGMRKEWNLGNTYTIHMSLLEGTGAKINGYTVTAPEFTGRYFSECETRITPVLPCGKEFSHWEINGEVWTEEEILVDESLLADGALNVSLFWKETGGGLEITEIKAKGQEDYIVLTNTSSKEVNTRGYCLMDEEKASHMNYLEEILLSPGESILIGCRNYKGSDAFMNVKFNLKKEEEVIFSYGENGIIERVRIPDLGTEGGVYRKDILTGEWKEERRE